MAQKKFSCDNYMAIYGDGTTTNDGYTVTGEEDWVIEEADAHLVHEHGNEDTPQLRKDITASLTDVS